MRHRFLPALIGLSMAAALDAQDSTTAPRDSFSITALQSDALRRDPRYRQLTLQADAAALRLGNIAAESRPALSLDAQGQYQSDVTKVSAPLPGVAFPSPPHDTYDAHLSVQQTIFDPSLSLRRSVERAQLEETQAQVRAALYALRAEINDAFFAAASLQERISTIESAILDLDGRLRDARERFAAGSALPGDTAAIAATIIQRKQDRLRLGGERGAALARLSALVGRDVTARDPLIVPDLSSRVAAVRTSIDRQRGRPEYAQFETTRRRLAAQQDAVGARDRPRLSAYGRGGYGRPGLNMLSSDFQAYWLGGLQLHWSPWSWGGRGSSRDRQLIGIQREIVTTNEAAFTESLRRNVDQAIAAIGTLEGTVALDERVVVLREIVEREAAARLREGVITAADYTTRSTELLAARVARVQHRVELAQARANLLTMIGADLP